MTPLDFILYPGARLAHRLHHDHAGREAKSAIAFLKAAVAYYNSLGVTVAGVMTDNGSCYKAFAFRTPACASAGDGGGTNSVAAPPRGRRGRSLN